MKKALFIISISFFICFVNTFSQIRKGKVLDEQKNPLELVSISILGTNISTVTNKEGSYELRLPGNKLHSIVISHIGYKTDTLSISEVSKEEVVTTILQPIEYTAEEIVITSDRLTLAERVILKTIERKESFLERTSKYITLNYNKLLIKNDSKKDSNITLFESVSNFYHKKGKDDKEEILTSRSNIKAFPQDVSPNIFGIIPSVYSDHIVLTGMNCISPLNNNALSYFSFELASINISDNKNVYRISFRPKYPDVNIPSGYIDIIDSLFQVVFTNLEISQASLIPISRQTIIRQTFKKYKDSLWLPVTSQVESNFPPMASKKTKEEVKLSLAQLTLINNYNFDPEDEKFSQKDISISPGDDFRKNTPAYWDSVQAIPLTKYEKVMTFKIDSIFSSSLLFKSLYFLSLLDRTPLRDFSDFYHFNRVEGHFIGAGLNSKKYLLPFLFEGKYGYGFSDKKNKFMLKGRYYFSNFFSIYGSAINDIDYLNSFFSYSMLDITLRSITYRDDYADYYYIKKQMLGFEVVPFEKMYVNLDYDHVKFSNAKINSNWALFKSSEYRSLTDILECKANYMQLSLRYDNSKYITVFTGPYKDLKQDHFTLETNILISSKKHLNSDIDYKRIAAKLDLNKRFSPIFNVGVISQFGAAQSNIPQFNFHLPANFATISENLNNFRTIFQDKYWGDKIFSIYIQNNFSNTPLTYLNKRLKMELILFGNACWINNSRETPVFMKTSFNDRPFSEIGFALNNFLISGLRIDFAYRLDNKDSGSRYGWSVAFKL
ncbi:MAG: DUF5686 family protein [Bacteroidota bacterium]|nr:DUF5686 family protein [Bacteroidota bacterium]